MNKKIEIWQVSNYKSTICLLQHQVDNGTEFDVARYSDAEIHGSAIYENFRHCQNDWVMFFLDYMTVIDNLYKELLVLLHS